MSGTQRVLSEYLQPGSGKQRGLQGIMQRHAHVDLGQKQMLNKESVPLGAPREHPAAGIGPDDRALAGFPSPLNNLVPERHRPSPKPVCPVPALRAGYGDEMIQAAV